MIYDIARFRVVKCYIVHDHAHSYVWDDDGDDDNDL